MEICMTGAHLYCTMFKCWSSLWKKELAAKLSYKADKLPEAFDNLPL